MFLKFWILRIFIRTVFDNKIELKGHIFLSSTVNILIVITIARLVDLRYYICQ